MHNLEFIRKSQNHFELSVQDILIKIALILIFFKNVSFIFKISLCFFRDMFRNGITDIPDFSAFSTLYASGWMERMYV